MEKIRCECGQGCDYKPTQYETVNDLGCNNSRMEKYNKYVESVEAPKIDDIELSLDEVAMAESMGLEDFIDYE